MKIMAYAMITNAMIITSKMYTYRYIISLIYMLSN